MQHKLTKQLKFPRRNSLKKLTEPSTTQSTSEAEENQVNVDRGIRNEITEDFIVGLKNLFEEHYIAVPDEKVDVLEGLSEDLCKMEERLNEQVKRNIELQNRLDESSKQVIVNLVSEGLADTPERKTSISC